NAVVAFDLILGRKLAWPVGMACVVIEGLLALVLVLVGLREAVVRAVPTSLKLAIGVGIGLFITLVGLREGGIVVNNPATGGALGVSSVTTYVESGAGVAEGARTGLSSVVTGGLFALAIFFVPLIALVGQQVPYVDKTFISPAVAPALVMVGYLMMRLVQSIDWTRPEDAIPAFLIIAGVPLTFSISAGIG